MDVGVVAMIVMAVENGGQHGSIQTSKTNPTLLELDKVIQIMLHSLYRVLG